VIITYYRLFLNIHFCCCICSGARSARKRWHTASNGIFATLRF